MTIPATSLAAVTVDSANPGIGEAESLGAVFSKHGGYFTVEDWSGGSGSMSLMVEGSLDGTDWFTIVSTGTNANGQFHLAPTSEILALHIRARAFVAIGAISATVTGLIVSAA